MTPLASAPSHLVLGTADLGATVPTDEGFRIMDRYAELGGDHLDTAHVYAAWVPRCVGSSERTVGAWLRSRGLVGRMRVATKGAHFRLDIPDAPSRVRPECIGIDLRESLDRLGLDRVDLWYLHRDDPTMPVEPLLDALERERRAGLIGAYAASNWSPARMAEAQRVAHANGWAGFCANQVQWSLAAVPPEGPARTRAADPVLRAWHRANDVALAAWSPQAVGFFARTWTWPPAPGAEGKFARHLTEANVRRWQRVAVRAAVRGIGRNRLALAWLLAQPQRVWPVVGCKSPAQVSDSMAAAAVRLSPAEVAELESGVPDLG